MKKAISAIFLILLTFACEDNPVLNNYLENCNPSQNYYTTKGERIKRYNIPQIKIGSEHFKTKVRYSLLEREKGELLLETSTESNTFTIYDLTSNKILTHNSLQGPPMNLGVTTFTSLDSIYFHQPLRGKIHRFDTSGTILETIDISPINLDWMLKDAPVSTLGGYQQGKIQLIDTETFLFNIDAFDFWNYPSKDKIQSIVAYNYKTNSVKASFGKLPTDLTNSKIYLPDKYTYPYFKLFNNKLYVSHPYDHNIQVYSLDGRLESNQCMSSGFIDRLKKPLKLNYDMQESINFHLSSPYYGPVNYHERLGLFSRIVFHEAQLYGQDGKLNNSNCEKSYSLILFNEALDKVDEIDLGTEALWVRAIPTSYGFIASGKCTNYAGEDYLRYNIKYEIR